MKQKRAYYGTIKMLLKNVLKLNFLIFILVFLGGGVEAITSIKQLSENELGLFTNGGERFRLDSGGNVGIGTTTPSQKLEVTGNAQATRYFVTEEIPLADNELTSKDYVDNLMDGEVGNANTLDTLDSLQFLRSDESDTMTGSLTVSGNIGIGTTSPATTFHIVSDYTTPFILSGDSDSHSILTRNQNDGTSGAGFVSQNANNAYAIGVSGSDFRIVDSNDIRDSLVRFLIDSSGNVGIGTTNPSSKFHVNGDIRTGGDGSKIIRDTVKTFTLPALGTKMAVMNIDDFSFCKVELYSGENSYLQSVGLQLNKTGSTETPTIFKSGKFLHLHSNDISFSSDASGNIWIEKKTYNTERHIFMKTMEVHRGDCNFLDGSTTMAGTGTDMSVRIGVFDEEDGKASYVGGDVVIPNGNVGVGTTTPMAKLDIDSGITSLINSETLRIGNSSTIYQPSIGFQNTTYIHNQGWGNSSAFNIGLGAYQNTNPALEGTWLTAKDAIGSFLMIDNFSNLKYYYDNGLTVGADYLPTLRFSVNADGDGYFLGNTQATRYFTTEKVPLADDELTSKEYVDDSIDGSATETGFFKSNRNFPNGTLVQTDIDYSVSDGDPWLLEIEGNSYGLGIPFDIKIQGYIYSNSVINYGGISNGTTLSGMVLFNYNGKLCFWWPYQAYWQGFNIFVDDTNQVGVKKNRLVSITNEAKPVGVTKEVALSSSIRRSWHSSNQGTGSGLDADLLDGIDSTSFLRSNESDTMTGNLILTGELQFGSAGIRTVSGEVRCAVGKVMVGFDASGIICEDK